MQSPGVFLFKKEEGKRKDSSASSSDATKKDESGQRSFVCQRGARKKERKKGPRFSISSERRRYTRSFPYRKRKKEKKKKKGRPLLYNVAMRGREKKGGIRHFFSDLGKEKGGGGTLFPHRGSGGGGEGCRLSPARGTGEKKKGGEGKGRDLPLFSVTNPDRGGKKEERKEGP